MAVRDDYSAADPGTRAITKFYGIDAHEHAAAINQLITDVAGKQASDADLTTIAGLTATTDNVIQSVGSAWASRTPAQLKATLALVKGDVGLGNVTNNAQYFPGGTDVAIADGGTGVSTLPTGLLKGAGTSAITAATAGTDYYNPGGTDVAVADGGTGASSASAARTNLGVVPGTDVLAYVAPTTPGFILGTSDGTSWTAQPLTRVNSTASSATPAINTDTTDQFNITALAAAVTSMTSGLTGTPRDGQHLMIRIKDNGTARAITWGASFVSSGVATLLATTVISKTHLVGLVYDSAAAKWVCVAVDATGY